MHDDCTVDGAIIATLSYDTVLERCDGSAAIKVGTDGHLQRRRQRIRRQKRANPPGQVVLKVRRGGDRRGRVEDRERGAGRGVVVPGDGAVADERLKGPMDADDREYEL